MENIIAQIRKNEGYTQEELASVLGVSREYVSRLESGKVEVSLSLADRLARTFGVTVYDVFTLVSKIDYDFVLKSERAEARNAVFESMMKYSAAMMEG